MIRVYNSFRLEGNSEPNFWIGTYGATKLYSFSHLALHTNAELVLYTNKVMFLFRCEALEHRRTLKLVATIDR